MEATAEGRQGISELPTRAMWAVLALSLLAAVVGFWTTVSSFHGVWTRFTYSHGYLVAFLALWLAWRRRASILRSAGGWRPAFPLLLALSTVWLAAVVTNVGVVHQAILPLVALAWLAAVYGLASARAALPAVAIFFFAVPFWEVLQPMLLRLTVAVSGGAVGAMGIEATIRGDIITISEGSFWVSGSCAGLNFFIIGLLIGTLYAHLFLRDWRARIAVVALAALAALAANWIRVSSLIVIGHVTRMESDLIPHHGPYGWVVFTVTFVLFFVAVSRIPDREPSGGGASPNASAAPMKHVLLATAAALLGPLTYAGIDALPAAGAEITEPSSGGDGWTRAEASDAGPARGERAEGGDVTEGWRIDYSGATERRTTVWTNGTDRVSVDWLVYREQTQGAELINDEHRIAPATQFLGERVIWLRTENLWVREALVQTSPEERLLVWYWFRVGGVETVSAPRAKLLELWAFFRRVPVAELIAVSSRCLEEECRGARSALQEFILGGEGDTPGRPR